MQKQSVYRFIVLDNENDKRLCGILSLGDIMRHDMEELDGKVAKEISNKAA
jgi:hypothetical protein